ncbi:MAG: SH3 domain-containing protein [Kiritimatiellia bacterium]
MHTTKLLRYGLALILAVIAGGAPAAVMNVQVRETQVRATPSFLGRLIATRAYGDSVNVQETRNEWSRVALEDGQTGWVHASALTSKRVALQVGATTAETAASGDELALAGKGFNSDVEDEFKRRNRAIDFTWVDRMEQFRVSSSEIQGFIRTGGLQPQGGE